MGSQYVALALLELTVQTTAGLELSEFDLPLPPKFITLTFCHFVYFYPLLCSSCFVSSPDNLVINFWLFYFFMPPSDMP